MEIQSLIVFIWIWKLKNRQITNKNWVSGPKQNVYILWKKIYFSRTCEYLNWFDFSFWLKQNLFFKQIYNRNWNQYFLDMSIHISLFYKYKNMWKNFTNFKICIVYCMYWEENLNIQPLRGCDVQDFYFPKPVYQ